MARLHQGPKALAEACALSHSCSMHVRSAPAGATDTHTNRALEYEVSTPMLVLLKARAIWYREAGHAVKHSSRKTVDFIVMVGVCVSISFLWFCWLLLLLWLKISVTSKVCAVWQAKCKQNASRPNFCRYLFGYFRHKYWRYYIVVYQLGIHPYYR